MKRKVIKDFRYINKCVKHTLAKHMMKQLLEVFRHFSAILFHDMEVVLSCPSFFNFSRGMLSTRLHISKQF